MHNLDVLFGNEHDKETGKITQKQHWQINVNWIDIFHPDKLTLPFFQNLVLDVRTETLVKT